VRISPPEITEVRRGILSARRTAGIVMAHMRIAETPEARNPAVCSGRPACSKSVGAYFDSVRKIYL